MPEEADVRPKTYDLFLSYSQADLSIAKAFFDALQREKLEVYAPFAEPDVAWGSQRKSTVGQIFPQRARAALVLLSEKYCGSAACLAELDLLAEVATSTPEAAVLLPVRLDTSPMPPP